MCVRRGHALLGGGQHRKNQTNRTPHNTTQHNTTQHNTAQRNTTQLNKTQRNTLQHDTIRHDMKSDWCVIPRLIVEKKAHLGFFVPYLERPPPPQKKVLKALHGWKKTLHLCNHCGHPPPPLLPTTNPRAFCIPKPRYLGAPGALMPSSHMPPAPTWDHTPLLARCKAGPTGVRLT